MVIINLIKALKAGNELSNPAQWKKGQILTNFVGTLLVAIVEIIKWKFPEFDLPAGVQESSTEIIAGVLVIINLYLIPATTKKIGVDK